MVLQGLPFNSVSELALQSNKFTRTICHLRTRASESSSPREKFARIIFHFRIGRHLNLTKTKILWSHRKVESLQELDFTSKSEFALQRGEIQFTTESSDSSTQNLQTQQILYKCALLYAATSKYHLITKILSKTLYKRALMMLCSIPKYNLNKLVQ